MRDMEYRWGRAILKSAIQKAVRRGEVEKAIRCAKGLMELEIVQFLHRITIIVMEDVILHPDCALALDALERGEKKLSRVVVLDIVRQLDIRSDRSNSTTMPC